jgi:hypothetical protein
MLLFWTQWNHSFIYLSTNNDPVWYTDWELTAVRRNSTVVLQSGSSLRVLFYCPITISSY